MAKFPTMRNVTCPKFGHGSIEPVLLSRGDGEASQNTQLEMFAALHGPSGVMPSLFVLRG